MSSIFSEIRSTCTSILKKALQIGKDLVSKDDSEFVEEFEEDSPYQLTDEMLEYLREYVISCTKNCSQIIEESKIFEKAINPDQVAESECPFLLEVWNGDMYDQTDFEALNTLLKELKERESSLCHSDLITLLEKKVHPEP